MLPGHTEVSVFPYWLEWLTEGQTTLKCFREIRIFIDSIAVLAFMSGYREDLIVSVIWLFKLLLRGKEKLFSTKAKVKLVLAEPWIIPNVAPFRRSL